MAITSSGQILYQRFDKYNRLLHGVLMFSFLGLAFTGLPLLFSDAPWASRMSSLFGGAHAAGVIHRVFASLMIATFAVHVMRLMHRLFVRKELEILWGPASMTPQPRDVQEMLAHLRWFLRLGPRPRFDHFTYWEKFPMDKVIFTGRVSEHELAEERPAEFERLVAERRLDEIRVPEGAVWLPTLAKGVGTVAVTLGLIMVALILYAVMT